MSEDVARMRLEQQKHDIMRNVLGCKIRLVEIEDDRKRQVTNIEASEKAMAEIDEQLAALDDPAKPSDLAKGEVNG